MKKFFRAAGWLVILVLASCAKSHKAVDPRSTVIPDKIYTSDKELSDGSLWPGDTSKNLLFEDTKAKKVGDIITVVVDETASSSQSAGTDTSKDSTIDLTTTAMLGLPANLNVQNFLGMGTPFNPALNATTSRSTQGSGTTTRQGTLTATISAIIVEILPNGNFLIEGQRSVTVNNEEQLMILRGLIRPEDVGFQNTIASNLIANASITYSGEGVVADEQRVGWATRLLSYIWPF